MNTRPPIRTTRLIVRAAGVVALAAASTLAGAPPIPPTPPAKTDQPADSWSLLAPLPPGVDAAAVLDAPGRRLFTDPAARAVRGALARTGMFSQTVRAWSGLAAALGYTEDEAAAALLGGRVTVVWDGLLAGSGGVAGAFATANRLDTRWAFAAEVDKDTARALRAKLKAAPRRTVAGRVVYTIDAGRIAMAVADDAADTRVLIAPVGSSGLLDALLGGIQAGAADAERGNGLGDGARAALGNVEPGWVGVAALRVPGSDRPVAAELRTAQGAWGLRFAGAIPLTGPDGSGAGAPVGVLAEAGADALFAAAFSGGPGLANGAIDVRMRLDEPPADGTPEPLDPLVYKSGSVVILHADTRGKGSREAAVLQIITHAASSRPFAERIDLLISGAIGGETPPAHRGLFPGAVRSHEIGTVPRTDESDRLWPGDGARVAWALAPENGDRAGVVSIALGSAGSDPAALAREGRDAWDRGAHDFDPSMLSAGRARPAALADLFGGAGGPLVDLARAVDRVEWTIRSVDGLTRGEVLLRPADPAARLGGP